MAAVMGAYDRLEHRWYWWSWTVSLSVG